jgi:hypothetical protein
MNWPGQEAGSADLALILGTIPSYIYQDGPRLLWPFATPELVSTERPLLTLRSLGIHYRRLIFTVRNHAVNPIALYVDRSDSGVVVDVVRETLIVPAGLEGKLVLDDVQAQFFALSAAGDPDGGFPSSSVSWMVLGVRRMRTGASG